MAELGRAKNILTLSVVSLPPVDAPRSDWAATDLAHIRASSDALYVFAADECAIPENALSRPAGSVINCANVLAKFLCQPHGRRIGFDFQDLRTALLGRNESHHAHPEQAFQSRYHYWRWIASRQAQPEAFAAAAMANVPLGDAATVLMYIESGPGFAMPSLRDLVVPIAAVTPKDAFIKYFVEVDPGIPADALTIDLYVRTDHALPKATLQPPHNAKPCY